MPKSTKIDMDETIVEKIIDKLLNNDQIMHKIIAKIGKIVEDTYASRTKDLEKKVESLETELNRVDIEEQHNRRNNVRIFGLEQGKDEDIYETVSAFCRQKLKCDIVENDIDYCYRFQGLKDGTPGPVVARFVRRATREEVFSSKKMLRGSGVVIREDLTRRRLALLKEVGRKLKLTNKDVWTSNGKVCAKYRSKIVRLETISDLNKLITTENPVDV